MAKRKSTGFRGEPSPDQRPCSSGPATEDNVKGNQAEYYDRLEQNFDPMLLTQRIYAKESESLQDWIKRLWQEYASVPPGEVGD